MEPAPAELRLGLTSPNGLNRSSVASPTSSSGKCEASPHAPRAPRQWVRVALLLGGVLAMTLAARVEFKENLAAGHCFAILVFVAWCWGTECIPPFVTALVVPVLVTFGDVLKTPEADEQGLWPFLPGSTHCVPVPGHPAQLLCHAGETLTRAEAAVVASVAFFDPVIWLFLSGFAMAKALEKVGLSERVSRWLLHNAGVRPSRVLLALMLLGLFLSMFLSNVAASVLVVSLIKPVLRKLPRESSWAQAALLGIAFSCNLGGMTTPIASPQNILALIQLQKVHEKMGFLNWCAFTLPFCLAGVLFVWCYVRWSIRTGLPEGLEMYTPRRGASHDPGTSWSQLAVGATILTTVVLWCLFDEIAPEFGHIGMVALLPLVLLFGSGLLTGPDFNALPWTVMLLLGGGLCLAAAVQSSGLLEILATGVHHTIKHQSLWMQVSCFSLLFVVLSTFLSSTVCAMISYPVVAKVGVMLGHPKLFVMSCCIMTSAAMALPVSSFPNANAVSVFRADGTPYLDGKVYLRCGLPISLGLWGLMVSGGFLYARLLGW